MKKLTILLLLFFCHRSYAQITQTACNSSTLLANTNQYCSANAEYAISSGYKYFQFIATGTDVDVTVTGANGSSTTQGTLSSPAITLFSDCAGTVLVGVSSTKNGTVSFYKGGLIIGNSYYIQISGSTPASGTFTLCVNNYTPAYTTGQDCFSANYLCSTATVTQQHVVGAGLYTNEAAGTCLNASGETSESNSIWYKWKAANNGTLVYTIIPNNAHDDIDWVLFDLDTTGNCSNVSPANAIRCKAGYGIDNSTCPKDTIYYKSGLDFSSTHLSEPPGCGQGQTGKLMYVTMQQGHIYGLLINNFSTGGDGFTLNFTDQQGKAGTGTFVSPKATISYTEQQNCTANPQFTFSNESMNYDSLQWNFGNGANMPTASGAGPYVVGYSTSGIKTVTLSAYSAGGCVDIDEKTIIVGIKPPLPAITLNNNTFCIGDTIKLITNKLPNTTYTWTGPNNFQSDSATALVPVTGNEIAGYYKLTIATYGCSSDVDSVLVNTPSGSPFAAFHTSPAAINVPYGPVTVQFFNDSQNADSYHWDFGDGSSSEESNPSHEYNHKGTFSVKLTAFKNDACSIATVKSDLVEIASDNYIFIPNTFTPNGDGINDEFIVNITNITSYHIQIFNRYGQVLYESANILNNWNGNYNNKPVPAGVYYYLVKAKSIDGSEILRSGFIALLR